MPVHEDASFANSTGGEGSGVVLMVVESTTVYSLCAAHAARQRRQQRNASHGKLLTAPVQKRSTTAPVALRKK